MTRRRWLCGGPVVLALIALAGSGAAGPAAAAPGGPASIIGGMTTTVGQYPSVVLLLVGSNLCTGTLVAPEWVLTAAHCVDPVALRLASQEEVTARTRVHVGTVDISASRGTVVMAAATFKDPAFTQLRLGSNDIGLIQLATPITDIEPSPINLGAEGVGVGTVTTVVGYGTTERGAMGTVGIQFELRDRTSVSCPGLGIGEDANLLCFSQADNRGTCQGDSGGPMFAMIDGVRTVVAVTSFGDEDCAVFGAGTRIDAEVSFLLTHAPELAGCLEEVDCPANRTCFAERCIADPFGPAGLGSDCVRPGDCESQQCVADGGAQRCSMACSVGDAGSCPDGFTCRSIAGAPACWPLPGEAGGCCDTGGGGPGALALGIAALGLGRRRRRAAA